jgi:hypothetical protein
VDSLPKRKVRFADNQEDRLARKPSNISFEQAAAVPVAAITALQGLRDQGQIERGQRVLIDGRVRRRGYICNPDRQIVRS